MPILDGEVASHLIHKKYPNVFIIVISICDDLYLIRKLYAAGCHGYLKKNSDELEIKKAISIVMSGEKYFDFNLSEKIIEEQTQSGKNVTNKQLTPTEKTLVPLFCSEKSNKLIAKELYLSPRTIEKHRYNIYNKVHVKSISGLIQFAIAHRII